MTVSASSRHFALLLCAAGALALPACATTGSSAAKSQTVAQAEPAPLPAPEPVKMAEPAPVMAEPAPAPAPAATAAVDGDQICKRQRVSGSNRPVEICATKEEWANKRRKNGQALMTTPTTRGAYSRYTR